MPSKHPCPICGAFMTFEQYAKHHCPDRTYQAIDSANTRAEKESHHFYDEALRPESERLLDGLKQMEGES